MLEMLIILSICHNVWLGYLVVGVGARQSRDRDRDRDRELYGLCLVPGGLYCMSLGLRLNRLT